jgi:hypothetical protein
MSRLVLTAAAVCALGCATTDLERRAREIAAGENVIARVDPRHPNLPELKFQLAMLRLDQAGELSPDAASAALELRTRALTELEEIISSYPSYSRLDEVRFWRAHALSGLGRWSDAAAAWRELPAPSSPRNKDYAMWRLAQALRKTHHCDEALQVLEGQSSEAASHEACLCRAISSPDAGC